MKNHSFMFLDEDFQDISNFCMRMEKNIVEGDGVDAVIWAGKIAERVTHYITTFINIDLTQMDQKTKLNTLFNEAIIPKEIYDQLDSIRQYRNIATHHDLRNEMNIARTVHKNVFNILCWFYGTYKGEDSYFNLKYPGVSYQHDESFLNQIKNNIYNNSNGKGPASLSSSSSNSKLSINQHEVNYDVQKIFNQNNVYFNEDLNVYTAFFNVNGKKVTIGHFKKKEVAVRKGYNFVLSDDFRLFKHFNGCLMPEKLENGRYSDSKGIDFDMDEKLWKASFDNKDLGYFISENSAIIARKEYIDTLPLPVAKNGSYSNYKEISFDLNHKLWYIKREGEILDYYDSEREAIHNLSNVYRLNYDLEDLGIVQDKDDLRWKVFYKNKYVAACDTKDEAIRRRLEHISGFAQPKRNKDGEYSIHRGIYFDDKNLIWILTIKGETLGFFDTEEDAFNYKKEFLKSKGFDVSNLIFHEEESFDDSFDFKVKLNSEENSIVHDKSTDEWIVFFRSNEIGRKSTEEEAIKFRKAYLKEMPYPPRKSNGKYSFIEGIDYDINSHLWLAYNNEELIGRFDSEEDAFYGLKEALVKEGIDVSDMHFINSDISKTENDEESELAELDGLDDSTDSVSQADSKEPSALISDENNEPGIIMNYYDVFKTDTGNYILNEMSDEGIDESDKNGLSGSDKNVISESNKNGLSGSDKYVISESNKKVISESTNNTGEAKQTSLKDERTVEKDIGHESAENNNVYEISVEDADNRHILENGGLDESIVIKSLNNIEEYKKSSFYGIANKSGQINKFSDDLSLDDLADDDDEYMEDLDLESLNLDENNGFLNISENLFNKSNRKDLREIKFNSYDDKNFRKEIILSYNDSYLCISLEGMVNKDELKDILFLDLLDNMIKLNYSKEDEEYFSIFIKLHYSLDKIDLETLINVLSDLGWEFDLLSKLSLNSEINLKSILKGKLNGVGGNIKSSKSDSDIKNLEPSKPLESSALKASSSIKKSSSFKDNLSLYNKFAQDHIIKEDLDEFNAAEEKSFKSKDYLDTNPLSKRKIYPKQESISSKKKKSKLKSRKAIIRGGVRVSLEEANELDHAKEEKVIKSNIIDKKPQVVKEFKTTSLDNILEANKPKEEDLDDFDSIENSHDLEDNIDYISESILEEGTDYISESILDEDTDLVSESHLEDNLDYISESTLDDDFDNIEYQESLDESFDSSLDYGDVLDESGDLSSDSIEDFFNEDEDELTAEDVLDGDELTAEDVLDGDELTYEEPLAENALDEEGLTVEESLAENAFDEESDDLLNKNSSNLTVDKLFEDDSEISFEDELDNIASSNKEDSTAESSDDSNSLMENKGEEDIIEIESNEDMGEPKEKVVKEESKPKFKKVKKPKKVPEDAFDERYANSTEIEYDEENEKWIAYLGGELIKSFNTPKEAYIERKKLLRRKVRRPKRGINGKYSNFDGIDFDTKEGLWSSSVNGIVINYSISEKEAFMKRNIFVDLILDKFDTAEEEFNEEILKEIENTNLEDLFIDLSEEDLEDFSNLNLKEVKKELNKF